MYASVGRAYINLTLKVIENVLIFRGMSHLFFCIVFLGIIGGRRIKRVIFVFFILSDKKVVLIDDDTVH